MTSPALFTCLGAQLHQRILAPEGFGARAWIMGVTAVQATVEEGRVEAHVRSHSTGGRMPLPIALGPGEIVHALLAAPEGPLPALPEIAPPPLEGAQARLAVYLGGVACATAVMAPSQVDAFPPPRAFGHVFCRWLREGGHEAGFDLTDFLSQGEGIKYERILSRPLDVGQVISYAFVSAERG
jgi:hypothetical protein